MLQFKPLVTLFYQSSLILLLNQESGISVCAGNQQFHSILVGVRVPIFNNQGKTDLNKK